MKTSWPFQISERLLRNVLRRKQACRCALCCQRLLRDVHNRMYDRSSSPSCPEHRGVQWIAFGVTYTQAGQSKVWLKRQRRHRRGACDTSLWRMHNVLDHASARAIQVRNVELLSKFCRRSPGWSTCAPRPQHVATVCVVLCTPLIHVSLLVSQCGAVFAVPESLGSSLRLRLCHVHNICAWHVRHIVGHSRGLSYFDPTGG